MSRERSSGRSSSDHYSLIAQEQRRQKRLERIGIITALAFVGFIAAAACINKGEILVSAVSVLQNIEGKRDDGNVVLNCRREANRKTPYCQDRRARTQSQWRSIQRFGDQDPVPFSLHGREDRP